MAVVTETGQISFVIGPYAYVCVWSHPCKNDLLSDSASVRRPGKIYLARVGEEHERPNSGAITLLVSWLSGWKYVSCCETIEGVLVKVA